MTLIDEYEWYYNHLDSDHMTLNELLQRFKETENLTFFGDSGSIGQIQQAIRRAGVGSYSSEGFLFVILPPDSLELLNRLKEAVLTAYPNVIVNTYLGTKDRNIVLKLNRAITGTVSGMIICHSVRARLKEAPLSIFEV